MSEQTDSNGIEAKAIEFAEIQRKSGWHLGWLVASSCFMQESAGRPKKSAPVPITTDGTKVTPDKFADMAGVSVRTVKYYFRAWHLAYEMGQVPAAKDVPNEPNWDSLLEDYGLDEFDESDDPDQHWSHYYRLAKQPVKVEEPPAPKPQPKPVDPPKETEDEAGEDDSPEEVETKTPEQLDAEQRHRKVLDARESIELQRDKLSTIGIVTATEDVEALNEIRKFAKEIMDKVDGLLKIQVVPEAKAQ